MDLQISILFSIFFIFEGFSPATTTELNSTNYDITEMLRSSIHEVLQIANMTEQIIMFKKRKLFDPTQNQKLGNETFSCEMYYHTEYLSQPSIYYDLYAPKMRMKIRQYRIIVGGLLTNLENSDTYDFSYIELNLENVSIEVKMKNESADVSEWILEISLLHNTVDVNSSTGRVTPRGRLYYDGESLDRLKILLKTALLEQMNYKLKRYSKYFYHNVGYYTDTIFRPNNSNFFHNLEKYFYLIPNIPYICFNLRNTTIGGLTNSFWLNITNEKVDDFGTTLLIKNIQGETLLDYGSEIEKPMRLIFVADDVFIRADLNNRRSNVEIRNYRVIRNYQVMGIDHKVSLTDQQSMMIMQYIESAIASSLMPSMKILRTKDQIDSIYDLRSPQGKMIREMTNKTDWKTIKKYFSEWIPFNEDQSAPLEKVSESDPTARPVYEYHISFGNISVKLISGISNPTDIQCESPTSLKLVHQINAAPIREIRWNDGINITFVGNFTSIHFSQVKSNSSSPNPDCEFQFKNDQNIKVELVSKNQTSKDEDLKLKKKIDSTLISMAKQSFVQNIKPAICLPFKICTQTAKIVDNFFSNFIDKVLKKCSLRKSLNR